MTDSQARIETYLMDTFDRGFGFADIQWTVEQLECRFNLIMQMVQTGSTEKVDEKKQESTSETFGEHLMEQSKPHAFLARNSDFIQAARAFSRAKEAFTKQASPSDCFQWSSNTFSWTDDINSLHEKKHFDVLINSARNWSMFIIFQCYIDACANVVKLSVGTIINGVTILLPVARFHEKLDNEIIDGGFHVELTTLISWSHPTGIADERKSKNHASSD